MNWYIFYDFNCFHIKNWIKIYRLSRMTCIYNNTGNMHDNRNNQIWCNVADIVSPACLTISGAWRSQISWFHDSRENARNARNVARVDKGTQEGYGDPTVEVGGRKSVLRLPSSGQALSTRRNNPNGIRLSR